MVKHDVICPDSLNGKCSASPSECDNVHVADPQRVVKKIRQKQSGYPQRGKIKLCKSVLLGTECDDESGCDFVHEEIHPDSKKRYRENRQSRILHEVASEDSIPDLVQTVDKVIRDVAVRSPPQVYDFRADSMEKFARNTILPQIVTTDSPRQSVAGLMKLLQHPSSTVEILKHLENQIGSVTLKSRLLARYNEFPAIFFVVDARNERLLKDLIKNGSDVNAVGGTVRIPLLAFALLNDRAVESTEIVKILLARGANPRVIPRAKWFPGLLTDPKISDEYAEDDGQEWYRLARKEWDLKCSQKVFLETRYFIEHAASRTLIARERQVITVLEMEDLVSSTYYLIGQQMATRRFLDTMLRTEMDPRTLGRPRVYALCGPTGHGKTVFAERVPELIGVNRVVIKLGSVDHARDVWGANAHGAYAGADIGTDIEKHIVENSGRRSVIVLDEFDKAAPEVWNSFIDIWETGTFTSACKGTSHDATGIIWLITTNAADAEIHRFAIDHASAIDSGNVSTALEESLVDLIRITLQTKFSDEIVNRVPCILPFVPFSELESAVVVSSLLLERARSLAKPIDVDAKLLQQNIVLDFISDEAKIAEFIAAKYYKSRGGARSIDRGVDTQVRIPLWNSWKVPEEEITDDTPSARYTITYDKKNGVVVQFAE